MRHFRYEKDANSLPAVMILQPITSLLPNFLNKLVPALQEKDQETWWSVLCQMQELLRDATNYLFKVI